MNATAPMIPAPAMSDAVFALTLALLLLAPLAIAGVALINAGLGRSRSAAQALLGNLALGAVAVIVFRHASPRMHQAHRILIYCG